MLVCGGWIERERRDGRGAPVLKRSFPEVCVSGLFCNRVEQRGMRVQESQVIQIHTKTTTTTATTVLTATCTGGEQEEKSGDCVRAQRHVNPGFLTSTGSAATSFVLPPSSACAVVLLPVLSLIGWSS